MTISTEVTALILAAGLSSRMGSPKALLPWGDNTTVIEHIIQTVQIAGIKTIWVVTGHVADFITPLVINLNANVVFNNDYAKLELLSSLKVGLRALPETCEAALVLLGDQPLIQPNTLKQLIIAWENDHPPAVAPVFNGHRGHPIVFSRTLWPDILALPDGAMPRTVLNAHAKYVRLLSVNDSGILADIDTPEDYRRLRK
jgi:molybdenum cofactor cytidylyltransferase